MSTSDRRRPWPSKHWEESNEKWKSPRFKLVEEGYDWPYKWKYIIHNVTTLWPPIMRRRSAKACAPACIHNKKKKPKTDHLHARPWLRGLVKWAHTFMCSTTSQTVVCLGTLSRGFSSYHLSTWEIHILEDQDICTRGLATCEADINIRTFCHKSVAYAPRDSC